jgi:hypothetical protein
MPSGLRKGGHRSGAWTGGGDSSMRAVREVETTEAVFKYNICIYELLKF